MECNICGQEVDNSEDLQKHKENMHAMGEAEESMDNLEKPDLMGEPKEESEREVAEAAEKRR
jgi:hypothetical protein